MEINKKFGQLASKEVQEKTVAALKKNGINAILIETGAQAREKVLDIIPAGAEVMNMTSMTLETIGLTKDVLESGKYRSVRKKLMAMNAKEEGREMRHLGAAADFVVGSVHAVTEEGQIIVASNTGSQLPAYAYAAGQAIWVVGAQKVVKDLEEGFKRLREYTFPLEDARAQKAYGVHSFISKLLIINREVQPQRLTLILVNEVLGF